MLRHQLKCLALSLASVAPLAAHDPASWVPQKVVAQHDIRHGSLTLCREAQPPAHQEASSSPRDPWAVLSKSPGLYDGVALRLVRSRDCNASEGLVLWSGKADELDLGHERSWFEAALTVNPTTSAVYVVILQHEPCTTELRAFHAATSSASDTTDLPSLTLSCGCGLKLSSVDAQGTELIVTLTDTNAKPTTYRLDLAKAEWIGTATTDVTPCGSSAAHR